MNFLILLLVGFFLGIVTTILPGLINMNLVKINERQGKSAARLFIFGACIMISIQVFVSGFIVHKIGFTPKLIDILRKIGLFIFVVLTIYFFFFANKLDSHRIRKEEAEENPKNNLLRRGFFLSAANLFPIPFYLMIFTVIKSYYNDLNALDAAALAVGVTGGTSIMFYVYLRFFNKLSERLNVILKNINYVIGIVTGLVSLLTLFKILWENSLG